MSKADSDSLHPDTWPTTAIFTAIHPSPLGNLTLAATAQGLCGVYFEEHKYFSDDATNGAARAAKWRTDPTQVHLAHTMQQLDAYFARSRTCFDIPLDLRGTPFQRSVWQQLSAIDFGDTVTYGTHAARLGRPAAVRAVGSAIGRNPVSIIVPCHRVIGSTGQLAGYAGGLARKRYLLQLEGHRRFDFETAPATAEHAPLNQQ